MTERSKKNTETLLALKEETKLEEPFLSILFYSTYLKIKRQSYNITDQPGCTKLRPKIFSIDDHVGCRRGYDLNYPRTIELVLWDHNHGGVLVPQLGLSGTIYDVSDVELQFARETMKLFADCQRMISLSLEKEIEWEEVYFMIDKRTFWKEKSDKLEDVAKALCGVQKFLNTTFLSIVVDIENLWSGK